MCHDNIIAVYEPPAKGPQSAAAVVQSLFGRVCGYHGNDKVRVYANPVSVKHYIDCLEASFEYKKLNDYNSSTLKIKNSIVTKIRMPCIGGIGTDNGYVQAPDKDCIRLDNLKTIYEAHVIGRCVLGTKEPRTLAKVYATRDKFLNNPLRLLQEVRKEVHKKCPAIKDACGPDGRTYKTTSRYNSLYNKRRVTEDDLKKIPKTYGSSRASDDGNKYLIVPYYKTDESNTVRYMVQWRRGPLPAAS